ncbi:VanW family protein [Candidatus Microgenomates bacterium]|nr:VanW family protein [Candidatus Microgenomates bacterium]
MRRFLKLGFYFFAGVGVTTLVLVSLAYLIFSVSFRDRIYPGIVVPQASLSPQLVINFTSPQASFSATAADLHLQPDTNLMTRRAYSVGRQTKNPYYNFLQILSAWQGKITIPLELTFDQNTLDRKLAAVAPVLEKAPVDAVFKFDQSAGPDRKGRVTAFIPSQNGLALDREKIKQDLLFQAKKLPAKSIAVNLTTKTILPHIQTTTADQMGIKSLLGEGVSYFYDSIPGRVYNIRLGTEKISGSLIAPGEIFSFDQSIGTVSAIFGFQKAYAIIKGKTVLDDGGGVCQVSTTLYRAALNAGLPIIARTAHTYRVGFYEQGGFLPGLDATVYPPNPDLKFKNDTGGYLLVQATFDPGRAKLSFDIFGTDDGRRTQILGPYILSTSPPPDPIYEDDPTLPVGQTKQVDTAHAGAKVYFKRTVTRGGETLINETVHSDFVPWPARYLRGTKS